MEPMRVTESVAEERNQFCDIRVIRAGNNLIRPLQEDTDLLRQLTQISKLDEHFRYHAEIECVLRPNPILDNGLVQLLYSETGKHHPRLVRSIHGQVQVGKLFFFFDPACRSRLSGYFRSAFARALSLASAVSHLRNDNQG